MRDKETENKDIRSSSKSLFLMDKPASALVFIKADDSPKYATQIAKGINCTFSHTIKILNEFKDLGLVNFEKKGRIKLIKLTPDGEDIAHDLEGLVRKFSRLGTKKEEIRRHQSKKKEKKK